MESKETTIKPLTKFENANNNIFDEINTLENKEISRKSRYFIFFFSFIYKFNNSNRSRNIIKFNNRSSNLL